MDINKPITNQGLLKAIRVMKKDRNQEQVFFDELSKAKFLCPAVLDIKSSDKHQDGKIVLGEGTTISISSLTDQAGNHFLMAFTDWEEVRKWTDEDNPQMLVIDYNDYQSMILESESQYAGFVINPYGENLVISKELISNIVQGESTVKKGESVAIGLPKNHPEEMEQALKEYFDDFKKIKSAYLLWMVRNGEQSYLLVLDSDEKPEIIYPQIGDVCKPYLNGEFVDMIPLNSSLGLSATEEQQPFYKFKKVRI